MLFEERIDIIMNMLKEDNKLSNRKLIESLGISESTLRRDLDYLESKGDIKRVHGGAILTKIEEETNFDFNKTTNIDRKKAIGKKAAALVNNNDFIFIDGGTTTHQMINFIKAKDITIVTNGIMHIDKLNSLGFKTILLGGEIKTTTYITYGELALNQLNSFNFDKAFIGTNGVGSESYSTADINESIIKKTAIKRSAQSYVLADSSKIGKRYFADIANRDDAILIKED